MVKSDDVSEKWCWLTKDGDHRVNRNDVDGGKLDIVDGMANPKDYSCLTWLATTGTARRFPGGCFSQGI